MADWHALALLLGLKKPAGYCFSSSKEVVYTEVRNAYISVHIDIIIMGSMIHFIIIPQKMSTIITQKLQHLLKKLRHEY